MIKCPNTECGHENVDGTQFCEGCGEELLAPAVADAGNEVPCPSCGVLNPIANVACEACGAAMKDEAAATPGPTASPATGDPPGLASTANPLPEGPPSSADVVPAATVPLQPGQVKLVVEQGMAVGAQFILGDPEILVGREDEEENIYPDIDLSDQDSGYVHRRHATLRFKDGVLTVTHHGGANKTRINNRPIPDETPQPLQPGDKIAFGKVVTRLMPA